ETRAVPAYQARRIALYRFEKTIEQYRFGIVLGTQRAHPKAGIIAKDTADGRDLMQMQGQKIIAMRLAPGGQGEHDHFGVAKRPPFRIQTAQPVGIRNGFQVKDQAGNHLAGRYDNGLTGVPRLRISKCRRGEVVSVWPSSAMREPFLTSWPVFTRSS